MLVLILQVVSVWLATFSHSGLEHVVEKKKRKENETEDEDQDNNGTDPHKVPTKRVGIRNRE